LTVLIFSKFAFIIKRQLLGESIIGLRISQRIKKPCVSAGCGFYRRKYLAMAYARSGDSSVGLHALNVPAYRAYFLSLLGHP
jgi:hypothetical protein